MVTEPPTFLAGHMATQSKDEFPSFLCSQVRAYHYVVTGLRAKVMFILGHGLHAVPFPLPVSRNVGVVFSALDHVGKSTEPGRQCVKREGAWDHDITEPSAAPALVPSEGIYPGRKGAAPLEASVCSGLCYF